MIDALGSTIYSAYASPLPTANETRGTTALYILPGSGSYDQADTNRDGIVSISERGSAAASQDGHLLSPFATATFSALLAVQENTTIYPTADYLRSAYNV